VDELRSMRPASISSKKEYKTCADLKENKFTKKNVIQYLETI